MVLFKSRKDVELAVNALGCRQEELKTSIATMLEFLVPEMNRRFQQMRRSGKDRRASRSIADGKRRGSDRRRRRERRLPPYDHLRTLRGELEQVIRLRGMVNEWQCSFIA